MFGIMLDMECLEGKEYVCPIGERSHNDKVPY